MTVMKKAMRKEKKMQTFNPPRLDDAKTIVYDVETNGLDWKRNHIVGYVVTAGPLPEETWYFPTRHETGPNMDHGVVTNWIKEKIAKRDDIRIVGHNLKFDLHMSKNEGIDFATRKLECTQVNAALIDENAGKYSLEACAARAGVAPKEIGIYEHIAKLFGGDPDKAQMANFWRLAADDELMLQYAKGDGVSTWQLWDAQQYFLQDGLQEVWELECRVLRTLFRMERNGVRIDEQELESLHERIKIVHQEALAKLPEGFNPLSRPQMKALMEEHGHVDWPVTALGNPSFPETYLLTTDIGRKVIEARKAGNMLSSFIIPMRETHLFEGRVHCEFNQLKQDDYGTVSGRLSSSRPNLQQVPKRHKVLAPMFRKIFLPNEGHFWSSNDYKQQEFVVYAEYTDNKFLVEGYKQNPPVDAHQTVANLLDVERDPTAKRMNLGQVYGMGAPKLAMNLGITLLHAKSLMLKYDAIFPEAKEFRITAQRTAELRGYVRTKMGRRRRFSGKQAQFAHKAGNQIIQGTSADITKLKMVEVDEFFERETGDQCKLLIQVHDDLCFSIPETAEGFKWEQRAKRIMESFGPEDKIQMNVPLRVDNSRGRNWGEASFPKEHNDMSTNIKDFAKAIAEEANDE